MKSKLSFLIAIFLFIAVVCPAHANKPANKIILKGIVIDTDSKPIQNASVFVDGKNSKILSDKDGKFKLKLKAGVKRITVYTIPHGATDAVYTGQEEITFVLPSSNKILTDSLSGTIVNKIDNINADYIVAHNRNLKKYVRKTSIKYLKNPDSYITIYDMIQGTVAGVNVSGSTITIRGVSSLVLSNEPLFIVNGIPVRSLDHLSPDQVESITVLKGASATIYGVRGANGVIVVNLKTSIKE